MELCFHPLGAEKLSDFEAVIRGWYPQNLLLSAKLSPFVV